MKRIIEIFTIVLLFNGIIFGGVIFSPGNASFSGYVKNSTDSPIAGCRVYAYDSLGNVAAFMETDSTGYYLIAGIVSGEYRAKTSNQSGYVDVWYINGNNWSEATPFTIQDADTLTGINFSLNYGGCISGQVKNSLNEPIEGVYIDAYDTLQNFITSAISDSSGAYSVKGLATGYYKLHTENYSGYINEWYDNKTSFEIADRIGVTMGDTVSGILFQLQPGGVISGNVMASDSGTPIAGVTVSLYNLDQTLYESVQTDSSGFYKISSIENGNYKLGTYNAFGYVDQFFNDKSSFEDADTLSITGDTLSNINFTLVFTGIPQIGSLKESDIKIFFVGEKLFINKLPDGEKDLSLFDISGVLLKKLKINYNNTTLDFCGMRNGVYFIKLKGAVNLDKKIIYIE
ncbi:MAG: T9SS type A sorting domain-containing protein [Proteobacteria bacterium]|nr:T9SS type A sorting domain-containing protein [Pseudomonadota bacterium]